VAGSAHAAAWRRAHAAKTTLVLLAVTTFLGGIGLVRAHRPSHHKSRLRPLAAPSEFTRVVNQNLLQSGIIAPAQAPPQAATSVS
jgi:hypothetical protein